MKSWVELGTATDTYPLSPQGVSPEIVGFMIENLSAPEVAYFRHYIEIGGTLSVCTDYQNEGPVIVEGYCQPHLTVVAYTPQTFTIFIHHPEHSLITSTLRFTSTRLHQHGSGVAID